MFYKKKRFSFPLSFRPGSAGRVAHSRPALQARTPARPWAMTQATRPSTAKRSSASPPRLSRCHVGPAYQSALEPLTPRAHTSARRGHPQPPSASREARLPPPNLSCASTPRFPRPLKAVPRAPRPPRNPRAAAVTSCARAASRQCRRRQVDLRATVDLTSRRVRDNENTCPSFAAR